ncbi:hypothetical protein V6U81_13760 [Micromonospora sp. CPCC 205711]|uniref:hypothetical protein n=1 Tax=Micromonospora sp. CPCC 205547 TaxID=3122400 RepID=UPI002FEF95DD
MADAPTLESPRVVDDPVVGLVERTAPRLGRPVDAMQVAAALESDGLTDRSARDDYGYPDVFVLAEEVFRRLAPEIRPPRVPHFASGDPGRAARDLSHGLLYMMPGVLLPAVLALLDQRSGVRGLLTAGAVGWVWSGGTAWLGYRLVGRGLSRPAARLLRRSALLGPAVAAAATALPGGTEADLPSVLLAAGLSAYQVAATAALFYRQEGWLLAAMAPAAAAGGGYLLTGRPDATVAVAISVGSVALAFALALSWTARPDLPAWYPRSTGPVADPPLHRAARPELSQLCAVLLYAALSAAYLLHADARYLSGPFDLAVAAAPLILGMGLVEWRARRFHERARALLRQAHSPRRFATRVWTRLAIELGLVTTAVAVLALPLLAALRQSGRLSTAGAVLIAAHVAVAGAYFVAFILAGHRGFGRLNAALGAALVAHLSVLLVGRGAPDPLVDAAGLLGSAVLLQAILIAALVGVLGQAWRYR